MAELGVKVGQTVHDADGKRLGKVTRCDPWAFEVRRGFFGSRRWVIRYDEILELGDSSVRVARSDADLFELAAGELPHSWPRYPPQEGQGTLPAAPGERSGESVLARSPARTDPGYPRADPDRP
jgi:hypothetical protein